MDDIIRPVLWAKDPVDLRCRVYIFPVVINVLIDASVHAR